MIRPPCGGCGPSEPSTIERPERHERAVVDEGTDVFERVEVTERTIGSERVVHNERTMPAERAVTSASTGPNERRPAKPVVITLRAVIRECRTCIALLEAGSSRRDDRATGQLEALRHVLAFACPPRRRVKPRRGRG